MTESVFIKDEWVDVVIKEESICEDDQTEGKKNIRAANLKSIGIFILFYISPNCHLQKCFFISK